MFCPANFIFQLSLLIVSGFLRSKARICCILSNLQIETRLVETVDPRIFESQQRIPLDSGLIFSFARSVLVSGREQRPLSPELRVSKPEQSLSMPKPRVSKLSKPEQA